MKTICDSCLESFEFTLDDIAFIDNVFVVECPGCGEENEVDEDLISEDNQKIILTRKEDEENTVSLEDSDTNDPEDDKEDDTW